MSAIWGYINLKNNNTSEDYTKLSELMKKPYDECVIERIGIEQFENGFFACGLQCFNKRSHNERLPIYDSESQIVFTADVVLNDRKKLIEELTVAGVGGLNEETPDGELSFYAWKKWGHEFTDHIIGLFAIAVYDKKDNSFYLFTDHTGSRCVDYSICGNELFFSTLSKPILNVMPQEYKGIDEQFIVGCEASLTPYMYVFPDRTPFRNVYHSVRGNYVKAEPGKDKWKYRSVVYYTPGITRKLDRVWPKNPKDSAYREAFRDVFFKCVEDAMDTDGEVAATISSGLDSSSVATVAAKSLQKKGRKLYGFTSVPIKGFDKSTSKWEITDESSGVKNIIAGYPNIEQEFCDCYGMSPFTEMDELVHMFEIPGKAFVNQVWMKYIIKTASQKGCKVMLTGEFGNFTISRGEIREYFFQKFLSGHVLEAKKQLGIYGGKCGIPRKALFQGMLDEIVSEVTFKLGINNAYKKIIDDELIKPAMLSKYRINKVLIKRFNFYGFTSVLSPKKMYRNLGDINILQTQGLYDTKYSLYFGVLFRDPTKDKRLLELCASFSPDQYVFNGLERRLVREYLDDYLPDRERLQYKYKGRQAADKVKRLSSFGEDKRQSKINEAVYGFMNRDGVEALMKEDINEKNALNVVRILALGRFFDEFSEVINI